LKFKSFSLLFKAFLSTALFTAALLFPSSLAAETQIPDCILSYNFGPEQYIIIVEKSSQRLLVYSNYKPDPIESFTITTGKNDGQKLEEGDMKTPEGLYLFGRTLEGNDLPKVDDYGEKAFTLNYPNPIDRKEKRNGSGIWLHGAFDQTKTENPQNSRGCVVMHNGDLVKVSKYIFLHQTPICIYHDITYDTIENIEKRRERLIDYLRQWKTEWENKNIDSYIGFYDDGFTSDGMNLKQFKAYKDRLNGIYRFIKVTLSEVNIYAYKDYFLVMFNQLYISDQNHFYSKKIQYWEDLSNTAKIVDEFSHGLPAINRIEISRGNYVTIDQFRRNYLEQLKADTITVVPRAVTLNNISIVEETVKLSLKTDTHGTTNLKVVPVLLLKKGEDSTFISLDGIPLKNGVPGSYSNGIRLDAGETTVTLTKDKEHKLKSVTLFLVNDHDEAEQIITYFVNK
jgi:murein L,D-transpeptidase YafK